MTVANEEIFGPVLERDADGRSRFRDRDGEPLAVRQWRFDLHALRQSRARVQASHQGRHGRHQHRRARDRWPWFPFNGWDDSFFGDLHMQGREGVQFFTQLKVTTSRWFSYGEGSIWAEK